MSIAVGNAAGRQREYYLSLMRGLRERLATPILVLRDAGGGRGLLSRELALWGEGGGPPQVTWLLCDVEKLLVFS